MTYDIVIRNGRVVDGTGKPEFKADIAIQGDRIAAIGAVKDRGQREVDADGKHVTPGFVDIHTHLDAQIAWDPIASSSCYHGVTSVVLGNCGVTFAPCKPSDRKYLAKMMESVEDIPAESIEAGLPWAWESYGEYLDCLEQLPKGVNVGGMVGHCAVRYHAMGERSLEQEPATDADIERICALVDEAIEHGALGFSTSRTFMHRVPDGRPVPGTYADPKELLAIGRVLGKRKRGVFEAAARLGERDNEALDNTRAEVAWMGEISRENGVNVTFGLASSNRRPELFRRVIEFSEDHNARGAHLRPQTTCRGIGGLYGLHNRTPFDAAAPWQALKPLTLGERLAVLRDPEQRDELVACVDVESMRLDVDQVYILKPGQVRYDNDPGNSLGALARTRGVNPVEAFIDLCLETDGRAVLSFASLNPNLESVAEMITNPTVAMGLADSGAHVGQIMDASQPTWLLQHWVREKGLFTIEEAVRRWTSDTADIFSIRQRGALLPGNFADVNIIDLDRVEVLTPQYVHDFPGGAGRYVQRANGFDMTIVNGAVFMENGAHAGALAGQMLRSTD